MTCILLGMSVVTINHNVLILELNSVQIICLEKRLVKNKDAPFSFSCLWYSRTGYEVAIEMWGVPVSHVTIASLQIYQCCQWFHQIMISGVTMAGISFCEASIDKQKDSNYLGSFLRRTVWEMCQRKGSRMTLGGEMPAVYMKKRENRTSSLTLF